MKTKLAKRQVTGFMKFQLYFVLAIVVSILIWLAFNLRSPVVDGQPLVSVSTETTHITEPLDANGDVDYFLAINQQFSENVTPENNAMAKFVQALGPMYVNTEIGNAISEQLGLESLPEDGEYFQKIGIWISSENDRLSDEHRNQHRLMGDSEEAMGSTELGMEDVEDFEPPTDDAPIFDTEVVETQFDFAKQYPWSSKKFPSVAKWLQDNEPPIQIIREGIERSHYYHPMVSPSSPPQLRDVDLEYVMQLRDVADCLSVHAMNHLGEDDVEGCVREIKSLYRLATHVSRGPTFVEELIGIRFVQMVFERLVVLCDSGKADEAQLKSLLQWVEQIKIADDVELRIDVAERYMGLETVIRMGRGTSFIPSLSGNGIKSRLIRGMVDWQEAISIVNAHYDRLKKVAAIECPRQRAEASALLGSEVPENRKWCMNSRIKTALMGRKRKGVWAGRFLIDLLDPATPQMYGAENSVKVKQAMLRILIAATIFKKETGQFPTTIDRLAPSHLEELPVDPLSGQFFVFEVSDQRLRIHPVKWKDERLADMIIETGLRTWEEFSAPPEEEFSDPMEANFDF